MKFILHKNEELPSIYCKQDIIHKVSSSFLKLTSYSDLEILGKSIEELNRLLRLDGQVRLEDINDEKPYYIFTKEDNPKEVNISSKYLSKSKERVYYFKEIEDSSLNDILANNFYHAEYDNNALALYSLDSHILLKANSQYIKLLESLNVCNDEIIGKPLIYKDFLLNYSKEIKRNFQREVPFMKKDNSMFYFDLATMTFHSKNKEKYLFNIVYDVTEKVLSRKSVEKQKEQMKIVLDNVSDKIIVLNNEREFTYINKTALDEMRNLFDKGEFNNMLEDKKIKPYIKILENFKMITMEGEDIPFDFIPAERVLKGEKFSNYMFLGTSDYSTTYNNVHGTPLYDEYGNQDGGLLIFQDITDSIILEEYTVLKEKTRDLFLNYASLSYPDFRIKYINNEGYLTLKEMNPSIEDILSLIGKNFLELYKIDNDEASNFKNNINKLIEGKSSSAYKCINKFEINGKFKYLKTIYQPVYNKYNKIDEIKVVGIDITKEKEDNNRLYMALKTQDEIFVNISHELKTPLHLIFSASQLLKQQIKKYPSLEKGDEIYYSNSIILQNCYRLTKLINNILDISKIESGFCKLDLVNQDIISFTEDIIDSVINYIHGKGLRIIFDTELEENIIALDIDKFERIMLNLISNAIKFSKPESTIYVNIYNRDGFIEIWIRDEGIGIATNDLDEIFKKFHQVNKTLTRETEGSGIGLSLVKSLVELHNGKIIVESVLGEGTTFKIRFPNRVVSDEEIKKQPKMNKNINETIKYELSDIY